MKHVSCLMLCALVALCGCAATGPTHDYYNPIITGAQFKGPVSMMQVSLEEMPIALDKAKQDGYVVIGRTIYSGKYPESEELMAQAKRVHANHVLYRSKFVPAKEGAFHFAFGGWGGGGGTDRGITDNEIVFLGK